MFFYVVTPPRAHKHVVVMLVMSAEVRLCGCHKYKVLPCGLSKVVKEVFHVVCSHFGSSCLCSTLLPRRNCTHMAQSRCLTMPSHNSILVISAPDFSKLWWYRPHEWWRVLSMPCGMTCEDANGNKLSITFGVIMKENNMYTEAFAGFRCAGKWKGWNWRWRVDRYGCVVVLDRWGKVLHYVPMAVFTYSNSFKMRDLLIEDGKGDWVDLRCFLMINSTHWFFP